MAINWDTGEPETKAEWIGKMCVYLEKNSKFAIHRAVSLIIGECYDWDDNTPREWGVEFLRSSNANYVDYEI